MRGQQEAGAVRNRPLAHHRRRRHRQNHTRSHRVAHLVLSGAKPDRVLLLPSRAVAARNDSPHPAHSGCVPGEPRTSTWVKTPFGSLVRRVSLDRESIDRRHAPAVGLAQLSVLDRGDAADLMDVLRPNLASRKSRKRFPRKDTCLAVYSHRVNTQRPLGETLGALFPWCAEGESQLTQLYRCYVEKKLANQALDTMTCCCTGTR